MKRVLLTTIHRPLGIDSKNCTKNVSAEVFHNSITLAQGPFSIRVTATGWGIEFIAANLNTPTTVLHYPSKKKFINEIKHGYDYIGISFVSCTFPKVVELCELIKRHSPKSKIILGGYGTVLKECEDYADYICREEGVNFMKRLLGESEITDYKIPVIKRKTKVLSIPMKAEGIIPVGLGCSRGCDFCCTSHFFDKKYIPILKTGREIYDSIISLNLDCNQARHVGIVDEDFLLDAGKTREFIRLNEKEIESPIMLSPFASLKSISQFTMDELIKMGLFGVLIGIESKAAGYEKLKGIDAIDLINNLKMIGVNVLTTMILGYEWHNEKTIEEDFQYLLKLKPAMTQFMIYTPCPGTPFYERMEKEGRLIDIPYKYHDGFHVQFTHPYFSSEELEKILFKLFRREYEELGPSVFRILENQLRGYKYLRESKDPFYRARANEHLRICREVYPLLKMGIRKAPSQKIKNYLVELKEKTENELQITIIDKIKARAVPLLYYYTKLIDSIPFGKQPQMIVSRYSPV